MIQIIIFSFNRAMQLDALLSSINFYWATLNYNVTIIYNTTDNNYDKGYNILQQRYKNFAFIKETNVITGYPFQCYFSVFNLKKIIKYKHCRLKKSNFRKLLNSLISKTNAKFITFLTDDSIFIRDVKINQEILSWIANNPYANSFSLRLGNNIDKPSKILTIENNIINWKYSDFKKYKNWGYPFSVDGHIYEKKALMRILSKVIFNNPSTLEAHIYDYSLKHHLFNNGKSNIAPYILSYPLNMVQEVADNESLGVSTELLNNYFLKGYSLIYPIPNNINSFQQYPQQITLKRENNEIQLNL